MIYEEGKQEAAEREFLAAREDVVKRVLEQQPDDEILYDLAELFKVFGDSTRIKILYSLFETELCVYDIARLLNLSQSSVSHQLRILKNSKLVKFRREGKSVFYSLDDEHVREIISMGMEHVGPFTFNSVSTVIGGIVLLPVIAVFGRKSGQMSIEAR